MTFTDKAEAVEIVHPQAAGVGLILCEHASSHIPDRYDGLGLSEEARSSHVAWDPGARDLALLLSRALEAPVVASRVSRLVYDCNRPPEAPDAVPAKSERFDVPGNAALSDTDRQERVETVYRPFCEAVAGVIAARRASGKPLLVITVHSFTPVYFGRKRDVEIGILHDADSRLADAILARADLLPHRRIARNEPYGPADGVTHSLKIHALAHGFANVMLEVRNDLLRSAGDVQMMADELLQLIRPALHDLALEDDAHV